MATHQAVLIPGDGIGPEVTDAVVGVLQAAGVSIEWDRHVAGAHAFEQTGKALPPELIESIRRTKVALKGPVATPIGEGFTSVNVGLRKALDLYANLRPVWNLPGVAAAFSGVDLVIVRENTEGFYADRNMFAGSGEFMPTADLALAVRKVSREGSMRIAEAGFRLAMQRRQERSPACPASSPASIWATPMTKAPAEPRLPNGLPIQRTPSPGARL